MFGLKNFTADENFIKFVKFPLKKSTYKFYFELYTMKLVKFFDISLTFDIVGVRNNNKNKNEKNIKNNKG